MTWKADGPWTFESASRTLNSNDVRAVYYRRAAFPQPTSQVAPNAAPFVAREAMVALRGFYDALTCPWISPRGAIREAENKPRQLRMARNLGLSIPATLITQEPDDVREFVRDCGPIVVKPLSYGDLGEGLVAHTTCIESWDAAWDFDLRVSPHLFQKFIPKGADYRVTVVDDNVFACRLDSAAFPEYAVDIRRGLPDPRLEHTIVNLPDDLNSRLIDLVAELGLRFGAIDLVQDGAGAYWFLEINPNGQWAWIEERTGAPISATIARALVE